MALSSLTRRQMMKAAAGFAALAAVNPFPSIVAAQSATPAATPLPAKAGTQVLRSIGPAHTRLSVVDLWIYYGPAMWLPPFQQNDDGSFSPGVCSSYTVSDDQLVYTFKMNPDTMWSDGTKVTAGDIKYSWEWMANVNVSKNSFNAYQTFMIAGNDDVVNGKTTDMSGLVVTDDDTLQITLSQPFAPFIYYCTYFILGVHQRANIENGGADWDSKPTVASGPFMAESFDIDSQKIVLVPNPYWRGTKPTLERIEITPISDPSSQLLAWKNDEYEFWADGISPDTLRQLGDQEALKLRQSSYSYTLNTAIPPLEDVHVRRAIQRAIDIETVVDAVWGDAAAPATGITHPVDPAYEQRPFLYDVDAARAELAQSTYAGKSLPSITAVMPTYGDNEFVTFATAMQQMLKDNLDLDLQVIPSDQATSDQNDQAALQEAGNSVHFAGPGGLMTAGWHANNVHWTQQIHTTDTDIETLLNQGDAAAVDDVDGRVAAYRKAEDLLLERAYVIPLQWGPDGCFVKSRVVGARLTINDVLNVTDIYIAAE